MFTSIILPLFGLLSIYHTFYTLITYIPNEILLFHCTVLTIFLQIAFVDQIIPYNSTKFYYTTHGSFMANLLY